MTAKEKFERAMSRFGLYKEWKEMGERGKIGVDTGENIIIFVHLHNDDEYSKVYFDTMYALRNDKDFVFNILKDYTGRKDMVTDMLLDWLFNGGGCPLEPEDIYYFAKMKEIVVFKDDEK